MIRTLLFHASLQSFPIIDYNLCNNAGGVGSCTSEESVYAVCDGVRPPDGVRRRLGALQPGFTWGPSSIRTLVMVHQQPRLMAHDSDVGLRYLRRATLSGQSDAAVWSTTTFSPAQRNGPDLTKAAQVIR
jgi:hypothetical protein